MIEPRLKKLEAIAGTLGAIEYFAWVGKTFGDEYTENYKDAFTGRLVRANNIRFAARLLHLIERPECGTLRLESCLYGSPFETCVAAHVRFEAGFECSKQAVALLRAKLVRFRHVT